jgi:hypothetical protein
VNRAALVLAGCLLAGTASAEEPGPTVEALLRRLDDSDAVVRDVATAALVERADAAIAPLEASATPTPGVAAALAAVRRVRTLSTRPRESVAYWVALDDVVENERGEVRETILLKALGSWERVDDDRRRLAEGRIAAVDFCRDWNEMYAPGSAQEKRYAELSAALVRAGTPCAPPLLRVLARNPMKAFSRMDGPFCARAEVRATFAVVRLKIREAVPHLVLQTTSPSFTLNWTAAEALQVLGGPTAAPHDARGPEAWAATRASLFAWWNARRGEFEEPVRWLVRDALAEARADLAAETAGIEDRLVQPTGGPHAEVAMARALKEVVGLDLAFVGTAAERLEVVRAAERAAAAAAK